MQGQGVVPEGDPRPPHPHPRGCKKSWFQQIHPAVSLACLRANDSTYSLHSSFSFLRKRSHVNINPTKEVISYSTRRDTGIPALTFSSLGATGGGRSLPKEVGMFLAPILQGPPTLKITAQMRVLGPHRGW